MQVMVQYRLGFQIISSDGFAKYHFITVTSCPADHFVNWYPTEYGKKTTVELSLMELRSLHRSPWYREMEQIN